MSSSTTEIVTTVEAFEALKGPWNELVDSMEHPEVFYLWAWNFHYFRRYRRTDPLLIIIVRHGSGKIAAIAPLCVHTVRRLGLRARVVETIVADIGDYWNILVDAACHRGRIVSAILGCLRKQAKLWDIIDISKLCSRDPTTFQIVNVARGYTDWSVRVHPLAPVAVRNLEDERTVENARQIRQIRNRLMKLRKQGYTVHIGCRDLADLWPTFSSLHRHAWRTSPLNTPHGRAFFDDLTRSDDLRDKIEFSYIAFRDQPVAMHFGFIDARKVYYYMPAMDRYFRPDRAGALLLNALVDHYGKTHVAFDFLRGMEDYKTWYTDHLDMNMRIVAYRTSSFAAFRYNLRESIHRFGVDLGLPKALAQAVRRIRARLALQP